VVLQHGMAELFAGVDKLFEGRSLLTSI
jgi:hypothetical protein